MKNSSSPFPPRDYNKTPYPHYTRGARVLHRRIKYASDKDRCIASLGIIY